MRTFPFIFIPLHSSNSSIPLLYEDSYPNSPHSYPQFPTFPAYSPHCHPYYPLSYPASQHSHPDSPHSHHSHPDYLHSYPDSPHSHHSHPDSPQFSPWFSAFSSFSHSVLRFPIPAFTESPLKRFRCFVNEDIFLKTYINKEIKIFAIRNLNALNAKWVPHFIKVTGIYCLYQASEQVIFSQFKEDTVPQLQHIFVHTTPDWLQFCFLCRICLVEAFHCVQKILWCYFSGHVNGHDPFFCHFPSPC